MKILFVVLPSKTWSSEPEVNSFPHIGVASLCSYLRKYSNHSPSVVDLSLNWKEWKSVIDNVIEKNKPDCIGVTVYTHNALYASEVIDYFKETTNLPVILGGPHVSISKGSVLTQFSADYAVCMDGEVSLKMLLDTLQSNTCSFSHIPNLVYRGNEDNPIILNDICLINDLDSLPYPDYSEFNTGKYLLWNSGTYMILTSRGCPYSCTYCSAPLVTGKKFRARSADNILGELKWAKDNGFKHFGVTDDAFNVDEERSMNICLELINNKLGMTWDTINGLRANTTSPKLFELMKKSGCKFAGFGLEAGTDEMLKSIKKGLTIDRVKQAVKECTDAGLGCSVNIIIGHPQETFETAMESIEVAKNLGCSYVNILGLIPMPETESYRQLIEMEKRGEARFFYSPDYYISEISAQSGIPVFETNKFNKRQREIVLRKGRNLSEYTAMRYRLGLFGIISYCLTRNRKIFSYINNLRKTKIGNLYNKIRKGN